MLASPAFRSSKQCQSFLRYVVEHSSGAADDMLKERTIGIEVFGRDPGYETSDDPVVRVRATEVRKRLAQYFHESAGPADVHFEIPQGSYRVEFRWPEAVPVLTRLGRSISWQQWLAAVAFLAIVAGAAWIVHTRPRHNTLDRFWAPVLNNPKPVFLYCGQPVVYFLSPDVHRKFRGTLTPEQRKGSYVVKLDPDEVVHGSDFIPVTDQFVGIGNAHTAAALSSMFAARAKPVEIRYANDLSFSDLRGAPSVLIGAFSNLWTLEMTSQLRFVFEQDEGLRRVRDRTTNRTWQLDHLALDGKTPDDYAIVSRLLNSATGQILIAAAGITQYGTRSAGELLTDDTRLSEFLAKAPADWQHRNFQVLLHTTVYKGTPAPPEIVATHFW